MFDKEILHKVLNYNILRDSGKKTLQINMAVFFSLPIIIMNITTLLKYFRENRCIKYSLFCYFCIKT